MKVRDNPDVLYHGEKLELLSHDWAFKSTWYTKDMVIATLNTWDSLAGALEVSKIHWESEFDWGLENIVYRDEVLFDMDKCRDLGELIGYLFQASIDGYTIRYVSSEPDVGIYLQRSRDNSSNIDADVLDALSKAVQYIVEMRK